MSFTSRMFSFLKTKTRYYDCVYICSLFLVHLLLLQLLPKMTSSYIKELWLLHLHIKIIYCSVSLKKSKKLNQIEHKPILILFWMNHYEVAWFGIFWALFKAKQEATVKTLSDVWCSIYSYTVKSLVSGHSNEDCVTERFTALERKVKKQNEIYFFWNRKVFPSYRKKAVIQWTYIR